MARRLVASRGRDATAMKAISRLRARVLALISAGAEFSDISQSELARRLGVRKSAVNQVFLGSGNIHVDTLAEYLAVMGLEADIVVTKMGELERARDARRAPRMMPLTLADHDRNSGPAVLAIYERENNVNVIDARRPTAGPAQSALPMGVLEWD